MRWTAIALITPNWHASPIQQTEHQVTEAVRFAAIPEWFKDSLNDDHSRGELGEHLQNEDAFCLVTTYEAPSASPQTLVVNDSINAHDQARTDLQAAATLLWLSQRTPLGFDRIVLAEELESEWTWREITSHDERVPLPSYMNADLEPGHFVQARSLANAFQSAKVGGTVSTAIHALSLALLQRSWPLRFLSLWLALEGLFGPTDARETTFRLCQRIALFIAGRGQGAVDLFAKVNESYRWRSKAIHGLRLQKLEPESSAQLMEETEQLVQQALRKLLTNRQLVETFDSNLREPYLDNLALL